jgi:hypothetical protein
MIDQEEYNEIESEFVNKSTGMIIPIFVPETVIELESTKLEFIPEYKEVKETRIKTKLKITPEL